MRVNHPNERPRAMSVPTLERSFDLRGGEWPCGPARDVARLDGGMVELSLLLPQWQAEALETAARGQGLTAGQMLRRIIGDSLAAVRR
jgi:hypothetical protein